MFPESRLIGLAKLSNAQLRGAARVKGKDPSTLTATGKAASQLSKSLTSSGQDPTKILQGRSATSLSPISSIKPVQTNPTGGFTPQTGTQINPSNVINQRRAEERIPIQNTNRLASFSSVKSGSSSLKTMYDDGLKQWAKNNNINLDDKVFKVGGKDMVDLGQVSQRDFQDIIRTRRALKGLDTSNQDRLIGMFDGAANSVNRPTFDANAPVNPLASGSKNLGEIPEAYQGFNAEETAQSVANRAEFLRKQRQSNAVGGSIDRNAVLETKGEAEQAKRLFEEQAQSPEFQYEVMDERGWITEDGTDPFLDYTLEGYPYGFDMRNNMLVDRDGSMTGVEGSRFKMSPNGGQNAKIWIYDEEGNNVIGTKFVNNEPPPEMDFKRFLSQINNDAGTGDSYARASEQYSKLATDMSDYDALLQGKYIRPEDQDLLDSLDQEANQAQGELESFSQTKSEQDNAQKQSNTDAMATAYTMKKYQSPEFDFSQTKIQLDAFSKELSAGNQHIYNAFLPQISALQRSANLAEAQKEYELSQLTPENQIENQYNQEKFDVLQRTQRQEALAAEKLRIENESARLRKETSEADKAIFEIQQNRREMEARDQNIKNEISNRRSANRIGVAGDSNGLYWMQSELRKGNEFVSMLETMGDIQMATFNRQIVDQYTNELDTNFFNHETRMQEIDSWYEEKMSGFRNIINQEKKEVKAEKKQVMKEYFNRVNNADIEMSKVIGSMNLAMLNQFNMEQQRSFDKQMKDREFNYMKFSDDRDYALQSKKLSFDQQMALQKQYQDSIIPESETADKEILYHNMLESKDSVKSYNKIVVNTNKMEAAYDAWISGDQKSAVAVDQVLGVIFQKGLDENSVVRESEFDRTLQMSGLKNWTIAKAVSIVKGGGMTDEVRSDLVEMARVLESEVKNRMLTEIQPIINQAKSFNMQPMVKRQILLENILPPDIVSAAYSKKEIDEFERIQVNNPSIEGLPPDDTMQSTPVLDGIIHYGSKTHADGLDISAAKGKEVKAYQSGTILSVVNDYDEGIVNDMEFGATQNGGWGNQVKVQFDDGSVGQFSHFSKNSSPLEVGSRVDKGQVIGYVGNTGKTYGKNGYHVDVTVYDPDGNRVNAKQVAAHMGLGTGQTSMEQIAQTTQEQQQSDNQPPVFLGVELNTRRSSYDDYGLLTPDMKEMNDIELAQQEEEFFNTFDLDDGLITKYALNKNGDTSFIKSPLRANSNSPDAKVMDRNIAHLKNLKKIAMSNLPPREAFKYKADGTKQSSNQSKKEYSQALADEMVRLANEVRLQKHNNTLISTTFPRV